MTIYLQTAADTKVWEEVDQFTLEHWQQAQTEDGCRYTGNSVVRNEDGTLSFHIDGITKAEMGILMRFFSIEPVSGCNPPYGFIQSPEFIRFLSPKGKQFLHQVGGENFYVLGKKVA